MEDKTGQNKLKWNTPNTQEVSFVTITHQTQAGSDGNGACSQCSS